MLKSTVKRIDKNITIAHADIAVGDTEVLLREVEKKGFDVSGFKEITSKSRRMEWLSIRLLLFGLFQKAVNIVYDSNGRPSLRGSDVHISFSHSKNKIAIAVDAKESIGVDIQKMSSKLETIKHKFLHPVEENRKKLFSTEELTVYWSAKEAIFKAYGQAGIFLRDILIEEFRFNPSGSVINGSVDFQNSKTDYKLQYELVEDYVLVYVLNT